MKMNLTNLKIKQQLQPGVNFGGKSKPMWI